MQIYNNQQQAELLRLALNGDNNAINTLISQFRPVVEIIASKYSHSMLENDDIIQEGMIGLIAAFNSYDESKGAALKTYAARCIENSIQSALRKFNRKKDVPQDNFVPYEEKYLGDYQGVLSAEDAFLANDSVQHLNSLIYEKLSVFENEVIKLYIVGESYSEIASKLGKTPKAIDNALQRIRKKLKNFIF